MLKFFATDVSVSKGYNNSPALRFYETDGVTLLTLHILVYKKHIHLGKFTLQCTHLVHLPAWSMVVCLMTKTPNSNRGTL